MLLVPLFQEIPDLGEELDISRRCRRSSRCLLYFLLLYRFLELVECLDHQEECERNEDEGDDRVDEQAISDRYSLRRLRRRLEDDLERREIDSSDQKSDDRVDDVIDEGIDDCRERGACCDTYCHIDDAAARYELPEFCEETSIFHFLFPYMKRWQYKTLRTTKQAPPIDAIIHAT